MKALENKASDSGLTGERSRDLRIKRPRAKRAQSGEIQSRTSERVSYSEPSVVQRRKCPLARTARGGICERSGCDHYAPTDSRVCSCCLRELSLQHVHKRTELLKLFGAEGRERLTRFEDEALRALEGLQKTDHVSRFGSWGYGGSFG